jgi:death-on-curing protein
MPGYIYPTVAEVLEIHQRLCEQFGGSPQIRERGRLEAAVFRPQVGYYGDLFEEAAALMESLANNHPFLDGNKRVCVAVADVFLRSNGFYLEVDPLATNRFVTQTIAKRQFRFATILEWIRLHARALPAPL